MGTRIEIAALSQRYATIMKALTSFVLLSILVISSSADICYAQELVIGVPLVEQPISLVSSDHPFAQVVREASTQPLLRSDTRKSSGIQLVLADSFSTSLDGRGMEIRLRAGAIFINSELVKEVDLKASLDRCVAKPSPGFLFKSETAPKVSTFIKQQRIYVSIESLDGQKAIINFLEKCPILEERSLRLFGNDLGSANLLLGTGPYNLVSRSKNREVRLERVFSSAWAVLLTVRGFNDPGHALTALQSGTIDAFYTQDSEVYEKASKDPTLLISPCGVYNIILRRGLELGCHPTLDPGSIRYSAS